MADGKAKRMWALPNAELTVPRSLLMHGAPNDPVTVPCPAYLIEHAKGLVLFDTGCHPKVADDPVGYWGPIANAIQVKYPKTMLLDKQIQGLVAVPASAMVSVTTPAAVTVSAYSTRPLRSR